MERTRIAKRCIDIILRKARGELSREQYCAELMSLEADYPEIEPFSFGKAADCYWKRKRLPEGVWDRAIKAKTGQTTKVDFKVRAAGGVSEAQETLLLPFTTDDTEVDL